MYAYIYMIIMYRNPILHEYRLICHLAPCTGMFHKNAINSSEIDYSRKIKLLEIT